ncbi:MAG: HAMP domain-containing protein, partial [Rhodocyclaceae bacterium]|nr:HAMP domain-containing protein [Rhodocyclaceae bacterium]
MTLRPATLAGRTVLLVFAAVLLAEIASSTLLFHLRRESHVHQVADLIVNAVEMSRLALEAVPAPERQRMVRNPGEGPGLQPPQAEPPLREPQREVGREISRFVRERLGADTPIRIEPPHSRALWVGFQAAGERWWVVMPGPRLEPVTPWRGLALLAAVTALIALLAAAYARHVARPLRALADATRSLGEGHARPVQPAGPAEVRTVALNFNAMLEQLQANERERAVMLAG